MLGAQSDFQFLSSVLILLRPFGVVFPEGKLARCDADEIADDFVLHNFAVLDDALDLSNQERANTHCNVT